MLPKDCNGQTTLYPVSLVSILHPSLSVEYVHLYSLRSYTYRSPYSKWRYFYTKVKKLVSIIKLRNADKRVILPDVLYGCETWSLTLTSHALMT